MVLKEIEPTYNENWEALLTIIGDTEERTSHITSPMRNWTATNSEKS
jgi:hypothetical protein